MIQYDTLYNMLVSETTRFILGSWGTGEHVSEDFAELISDISKCFYEDDGNYSSLSSAIRVTMKSLEIVQNPLPDKVLMLRNMIISILFSQKYQSFKTPGDLYIAFEDFKKEVDKTAAQKLITLTGLTIEDVKSIQTLGEKSPAIRKLEPFLITKAPAFIKECVKYISLV